MLRPSSRTRRTASALNSGEKILRLFCLDNLDSDSVVERASTQNGELQIDENGFSVATFVNETGEIKGLASWEEGSFVQFTPGKIAAVAPGDYIVNYSINGLEPQDRLGRVRIILPD